MFARSPNGRGPLKVMGGADAIANVKTNEESFQSSMKNGSYKDEGGGKGWGRQRKTTHIS